MKIEIPSARHLPLACLFFLCLLPGRLSAKDFPDPVLAADPLGAASRGSLPAGMGGAFESGNYAFAHDDVDSFYFRLSSSPVFFDLSDSFALGGIFDSILMCGPVKAGTTAANIADFWMNAVQFQYGLYASAALPFPGGPRLLAEYSRTSQHPLRSPDFTFSQVSADLLLLGVAAPAFALGPLRLRSSLRGGYSSLFAFWQSSLPQPRISWLLKLAAEAELPLRGACFLVARAYPELFLDRYSSALDADIFAEAGVVFAQALDSAEILLTLYQTRNSDLLEAPAVHPTFEAGLALRFSYDRARPPAAFR